MNDKPASAPIVNAFVALVPTVQVLPSRGSYRTAIHIPSGRHFRITTDLADLFVNADSSTSKPNLDLSPMQVDLVKDALRVLKGGSAVEPPPLYPRTRQGLSDSRFASVTHSIQTGIVAFLVRPPGVAMQLALFLGGIVSLISAPVAFIPAGQMQLGSAAWIALICALLAAVSGHELAHAASLRYFGGHVGRLSIMMFHLFPTPYCDTQDIWRIGSRYQRFTVFAAGVWFNTLVGFGTFLVTRVIGIDASYEAYEWSTLFGLGNLGLALTNIIPFAQLDGYQALAALTNRPYLREEAIDSVRARLPRFMGGRRNGPANQHTHEALWLAFGALSLGFTLILGIGSVALYVIWACMLS